MIRKLLTAVALSGAVAIGIAAPVSAADKDAGNKADAGAVQPDNSKVNKQDRGQGGVTADQQKENPADRKMSQQIRRAIVKDKSLSVYAHNVKIITRNGNVTLKGPVRSEQEKSAVEAAAAKVVGNGKINNELTVAKKQDKKQEKKQDKEKKQEKQEKQEKK